MQERLVITMKKNNVTIKELSHFLGISERQTSLKIKGKAEFKCSEMFKIATLFKKTVDEIFLPSMYENGTFETVHHD